MAATSSGQSGPGSQINIVDRVDTKENFQGPHDWRKRLRPVHSPDNLENAKEETETEADEARTEAVNVKCPNVVRKSSGRKGRFDDKIKEKLNSLPPWKRDLMEKRKRAPLPNTSNGSSNVHRKRSFNRGQDAFTMLVVNNEGFGPGVPRRRASPSNSFKQLTPSNSFSRRSPGQNTDTVVSGQNIQRRIEKVKRARLYLLQQSGPNTFVIGGDSPDHKFRVIIGPQSCSCGKGPHCVHLLFVILRVFQIEESDPLVWSKTLKNYEVENLFRNYHIRRKLRISNQANDKEKSKKSRKRSPERSGTPSPESSVPPSESDTASVRGDPEDEQCPICLLEMLEGESLVKCEGGCHNRLHHHCIAIWFEECRRQNERLNCPLCRAQWKNTTVTVKSAEPTDGGEAGSTEHPPVVPPNTRAPSPQPAGEIDVRLPYAEPIPADYLEMSAPWMQVLGEDLVPCFFSRNWSIRETGLKHLSKEAVALLLRGAGEGRSGVVVSPERKCVTHKMLETCCSVLAFMCADPVYKVFVACLRSLRTLLAYTPCRDEQQQRRLQSHIRPIVDAIVLKCTDGNRRMSQLSLSTLVELAKGQSGELAVGKEIVNPGSGGLGGLNYVVDCMTADYNADTVPWQWLLGRLSVIERLFEEFPNQFLLRDDVPDGASSGSCHGDGAGAAEALLEEHSCCPEQAEKLVAVARFALKGVANAHSRINKMSRRVFLAVAQFSAHMHAVIADLEDMLKTVDPKLATSMKRRMSKMVENFHLSEKIVYELHHGSKGKGQPDLCMSPMDTPAESPTSSPPRCNSPVTSASQSDCQSEAGSSTVGKSELLAPPNTPIRIRQKLIFNKGKDISDVEEEAHDVGYLSESRLDSLEGLDFGTYAMERDRLNVTDSTETGHPENRVNTAEGAMGPSLCGTDDTDMPPPLPPRIRTTFHSRSFDLENVGSPEPVFELDHTSEQPPPLPPRTRLVIHSKSSDSGIETGVTPEPLCGPDHTTAASFNFPILTGDFSNNNVIYAEEDDEEGPHFPVATDDSDRLFSFGDSEIPQHAPQVGVSPKSSDLLNVENVPSAVHHTEPAHDVLNEYEHSIPPAETQKVCELTAAPEMEHPGNTSDSPDQSQLASSSSIPQPLANFSHRSGDSGCEGSLKHESTCTSVNIESHLLKSLYVNSSFKNITSLNSPPSSHSLPPSSRPKYLQTSWNSDRLTTNASSLQSSCNHEGDSATRSPDRSVLPSAEQNAMSSDELLDLDASDISVRSPNEKPVTFQTEVAGPTPKSSPSHTIDQDEEDDNCRCKEEVELEEAVALAKALEVSEKDPPKPIVPGLTPTDREEVVTIRIQPDDITSKDGNGNQPSLYYENVHWVKGPLIGTGAYSTCYQARDIKTGTIMAVKQVSFCRNSRTEQEKVVETIAEEINMMAKLNHPNIVRIMGATKQGCHFNMFVEWMPGGSVSYLLGQYGAFSDHVMTSYTLQILRGLAYLHDNHLLHRDLKGANLLVDSTGQRLRIGDFGAAARLASQATGAGEFQGQLLGTIAFMAPEVLRGENYGRVCDIWSVGCVIIEMATTKPPWNAHDISNHLALIFRIATSITPPPIPDNLSPPLRDLALRCLEQQKEDRPTAKELLIHPLFTRYMAVK